MWRGKGHGKALLGVDFLRGEDGRGLLVSGGLDRDIRVWVEDHDGDEGKLQNGEKEDHPLGDKAVPPVDGANPPTQREASEMED
jgi:hypothetical protein